MSIPSKIGMHFGGHWRGTYHPTIYLFRSGLARVQGKTPYRAWEIGMIGSSGET